MPGRSRSRYQRDVKFLILSSSRNMPVTTDHISTAGARVVASYDAGAHAVSVPEAERDAFLTRIAARGAEIRELADTIHTPGRTFDPDKNGSAAAGPAAGLYIVQYVAPTTPAWQASLREAGVVVVQPIPERAAVVVASRGQADTLREHAAIQYVGPYTRADKFKPAPTPASEFVVMVADTAASVDAIAEIEQRVGPLYASTSFDGVLTARFRTDRAAAEALLDNPFVLGVETYVRPQPSDERQALSLTGATTLAAARVVAGTPQTPADYRAWLDKYGFTSQALAGSSIVVDVADTGIDMGCSAPHLSTLEHPDLKGRVVYHNGAYPQGIAAEAGSQRDPKYKDTHGHGTIVAGIIGGNPLSGVDTAGNSTNGRGLKDSDNLGAFYFGMGIAPGIRIGNTVMMDPSQVYGVDPSTGMPTIEAGVRDWTTRAVTRSCNTPTSQCTSSTGTLCRATVQNHSNNEYLPDGYYAGYYTTSARAFDKSVRQADHATNIPLTITASAGNIGQDASDSTWRVLAPATAKNVIAVGAVESFRSPVPSLCQTSNQYTNPQGTNPHLRNMAEGWDVISYSSRRGTIDNRLKPDIVTPATLAMGPYAYPATNRYCFIAGGTNSQPWYQGTSGTSFAAPVAAGSVALLGHFYSTRYPFTPSPAMYKAMLVAGARPIRNGYDRYFATSFTSWPVDKQGFGVVALENLFNSAVARDWRDQGTPLLQSQSAYYTLTVSNPTQPVKIVLAWTDAPGSPQDPATGGPYKSLVNDLDLRASLSNGTYYGNYFDAVSGYSRLQSWCGRPSCPPPADVRNNVEVLNIDPALFANGANGSFTVRVLAPGLTGIGVPGYISNNQDFALFVINGTLQNQ